MRFIVERFFPGTWECHSEGNPELVTGGPTPETALRRACKAYGVEMTSLSVVERSNGRLVFSRPAPCPDCGGTGRYVGLTVVEDCEACGGDGKA